MGVLQYLYMAKKIVVANWKMHPKDFASAKKLFLSVKEVAKKLSHVQTIIAPPFVFLPDLAVLYSGHRILFAGQDVFWGKEGSFTGEISAPMLKDSGATHCIIGHSERRALGESNEDVSKKIHSAVENNLTAIFCIGESERNHHDGIYLEFLTQQIESGLSKISKRHLSRLIVAYEPIWAIGKDAKDAMKPQELHETTLLIKKVIAKMHGKSSALKVPILYGGSVEKENAQTLLSEGKVQGFLVGHASLDGEEFSEILRIAQGV